MVSQMLREFAFKPGNVLTDFVHVLGVLGGLLGVHQADEAEDAWQDDEQDFVVTHGLLPRRFWRFRRAVRIHLVPGLLERK